MKRPPHLEGIAALEKAGADFVLVGALGIGHYESALENTLATFDCDVVFKPSAHALERALDALTQRGAALELEDGPLSVKTRLPGGMALDLMLEAPPFPYALWRKRSNVFTAAGVRLNVGSLDMLLEAKRRADRPKDRAFLAQWKALHPAKKKCA